MNGDPYRVRYEYGFLRLPVGTVVPNSFSGTVFTCRRFSRMAFSRGLATSVTRRGAITDSPMVFRARLN